MAEVSVKHQMKVLWEAIELDALRAEDYLKTNPGRPHIGAHTCLAKQVKENVDKLLKLLKSQK